MAGLDKIISQIKEESQKAAERTRAEAVPRQMRFWHRPVRTQRGSALILRGAPNRR